MDLAAALGSLSSVGLSTGVGLLVAIVLALLALSLVTYIPSGSIPRTIASGSWNATALNTGRWRVPITFTNASTHTSFAGSYIAILANGLGAFWIVDRSLALYNQSGAVVTRPITWSAGQTITVVMDLTTSTGSITISGALTGNGTYTFTNTGTYFVAAETLGIGVYNGGGYNFTGTIGQVDDADDSLSFTADPAPSTGAGAAGTLTPGVATMAGTSGSSTAGANDPTAVSNGLVPDPAPSTGAGAGGTLVGGAVSIAGGTGTSTASASDPTASNRTVRIGAHGIDFQVYGNANRDASVTLTLTAGSTVIIFTAGLVGDVPVTPTSSHDEKIRKVGPTWVYPDYGGAYAIAAFVIQGAVGGSTTITQPVTLFSENTMWVGEAIDGGLLRALVNRNVANASGSRYMTSTAATAVAAAVNFSLWWGAGPVFSPSTTPFGAVPDRGTVLDSYLVNNSNGQVQAAIAGSEVTPGTYDTTWDQFPSQGAQTFEIIIEGSFPASSAPSTGALGAGQLTGGAASIAGAALGSSAGAEQPVLQVTLRPDAAPSTGALAGGALTPGAASLAGSALGGTAGAEQPTALLEVEITALPAPSTGALAAGVLTAGAASISGAALGSTAGAEQPILDPGNVDVTPATAPSTGALGAGQLTGGAASIAGSALGAAAGAEQPALDPGTVSISPLPAPSSGALAAGSLTSGGVSLSGAALGGTAGAEQPALSGGGILAVPAAPSTGALGAGALTPGGVSRSPDPAPSTGGRGAGALSPGAVALAGAALGSTAGAEQPTAASAGLILAPLPAPSTGALGAGQLAGGAASIAGAALSGTAGASKPAAAFLGLVLVLPQVPRVLRAIGSGPRSLRALGSGPRNLREV